MERRPGETPRNRQYRLRNAYHLDELASRAEGAPDWLVYTKPFTGFLGGKEDRQVGGRYGHCLEKLRAVLGPPDYEDDFLLAYDLAARLPAP